MSDSMAMVLLALAGLNLLVLLALWRRSKPPADTGAEQQAWQQQQFEAVQQQTERLERELRDGTYRPGAHTRIELQDPKHRIVSAAPFRDRVAHHAACAVVEPIFARGFIDNSFANRAGKGTHRAIARWPWIASQPWVQLIESDVRSLRDIGGPIGTDTYTPVDGKVLSITPLIVNGTTYGDQIAIEPLANPGVVVVATGIRADPALSVGSPVSTRPEAWTKLGRIVDVTGALDPVLADYTQDGGNRIHLEVRPATSVAAS